MEVGNAPGMEMTKALVPQDAQLIASKVMEKVEKNQMGIPFYFY